MRRALLAMVVAWMAGCGSTADAAAMADTSGGVSSSDGSSSFTARADESSTGAGEVCCGCLCVDDHWSCSADTCVTADGVVATLAPEAGFFAIDSGSYSFADASLVSPHHRVWYAFRPADTAPEDAPVLLFFNGGPGVSTAVLFGLDTNAYTFDPDRVGTDLVAPTREPWTRSFNLLYVDAPATGFSYPITLPDGTQPSIAIDADRDAAAFVRVLLRFLARHPALRDNRVALVGESYGGTRATLMLQQLLRYDALDSGDYRDPELEAEIRAHYEVVFGTSEGLAPSAIAEQFALQVLVQGSVTGIDEPLGLDDMISPSCIFGGDSYQCDEPDGWAWDFEDELAQGLVDLDALELALGVDPTTIEWLHADARTGAYGRGADGMPVDTSTWEPVFGVLGEDDRYFIMSNSTIPSGLPGSRQYLFEGVGRPFLWNAAYVRTLFTDAGLDNVIRAPQIGPMVAKYTNMVASVQLDPLTPSDAARPGRWVIALVPDVIADVGEVELRFPHYSHAGHMVTARAAGELLADIEAELAPR